MLFTISHDLGLSCSENNVVSRGTTAADPVSGSTATANPASTTPRIVKNKKLVISQVVQWTDTMSRVTAWSINFPLLRGKLNQPAEFQVIESL